jgi:hypothetical protein
MSLSDDKVKEYIALAVQSGKSETSGIVSDIFHKIDGSIAVAVEKYINGHLRDIKGHLKDQDAKLEVMGLDIAKIKKDTDPIVETKKGFSIIGKLIVWISVIGGAIIGIYKILKL